MGLLSMLLYNVALICIVSYFFHNTNKRKILIQIIILEIVNLSCFFTYDQVGLKQLILISTLVLIIYHFYTHSLQDLLICVFVVIISLNMTDLIFYFIDFLFYKTQVISYFHFSELQNIINACLMSPSLYMMGKVLVKQYEVYKQINKHNVFFVFLILTQLFITYSMIMTAYMQDSITQQAETFFIPSIMFLLTVFYSCYHSLKVGYKTKALSLHNTLSQQNILTQQKYYFSLFQQQELTLELYGEITNHINEMMVLLNENDEMLNTYVEALYGKYDKLQNYRITNHSVLNAILIHYYQICSIKRIVYNADVRIQEDQLLIEDYHLSLIINNLLENAVRYSGEQSEICITIKLFYNQLLIQVNNKIIKEHQSHKKISGYGFSIVKDIVSLYEGTVEIDNNKDNFKVNIMMENRRYKL